jgi:hypothetical protein
VSGRNLRPSLFSFVLIVIPVSAAQVRSPAIAPEPTQSQSCGDGWCLTFPVGVLKVTPPFGSSAWNKLVYVPDDGRFFIYSSDGIYTFSNSWWSYGVLHRTASANPWIEESSSGTVQSTVTDNSKGFLKSAIGPADTVIALGNGEGKSFHPDPVQGGIVIVDEEEISYALVNRSGDSFFKVIRGVRGTTAASHNAGAMVTAGSPLPQSRRDGKLVPVNDHLADRHPFLMATYDSRRHQLFQAGGITENGKLTDTWYFCLVRNEFCPAENVRVWKRLLTPTAVPARADSAMTYDSDDDAMIFYGGQSVGNPQAETWLLCFKADPQISGHSIGCPAAGSYPDWVRVQTNGSPGPRFAHGVVYDSGHHAVVLFGGVNGTPIDPSETWIYSPARRKWTNASPAGRTPAGFRRPAMTFDTKRGLIVLYEGPPEDGSAKPAGALYFYDAGANTWELSAIKAGPIPSSPEGGRAHGRLSLDYDPKTDTFVATELGSGYSLQVWELKGSALDTPIIVP